MTKVEKEKVIAQNLAKGAVIIKPRKPVGFR
jgi:hypothetical protein